MTSAEARQILLLRRGPADDSDPAMAEALAVARHDPELREWLQAQETFHRAMRSSFRNLPVPEDLSRRILDAVPAARPRWWQRFPAWAAAAALIATLFIVVGVWDATHAEGDTFSTFRSRMVRSVLRQYQMDLETNSMVAIRQFLTTNQAPADYVLTSGLGRLAPRGAGLQSWLGQRVSMVCFDANGRGTAVLFVLESTQVKNPPPHEPAFEQVSKLMTASWTEQGRAYLLMIDNAAVDRAWLSRLLRGPA